MDLSKLDGSLRDDYDREVSGPTPDFLFAVQICHEDLDEAVVQIHLRDCGITKFTPRWDGSVRALVSICVLQRLLGEHWVRKLEKFAA